jgi:hypothetical protein
MITWNDPKYKLPPLAKEGSPANFHGLSIPTLVHYINHKTKIEGVAFGGYCKDFDGWFLDGVTVENNLLINQKKNDKYENVIHIMADGFTILAWSEINESKIVRM